MNITSTRRQFVHWLNLLWVYILCVVLSGAYLFQAIVHENPCPLCELQRVGMLIVGIGPLMNLKWGVHPHHYAVSIFGMLIGGSVSLFQICLHICPGFPTFGTRVLGLELYTWAFLVFSASLLGLSLLLFFWSEEDKDPLPLQIKEKVAFGLYCILCAANIVTAYLLFGLFHK